MSAGAPSAPGVKQCCQEPLNLEVTEKLDDRETKKCKVCGCRHFRVFPFGRPDESKSKNVPIG